MVIFKLKLGFTDMKHDVNLIRHIIKHINFVWWITTLYKRDNTMEYIPYSLKFNVIVISMSIHVKYGNKVLFKAKKKTHLLKE